jgi:hypothetical protein
MMIYIYTELSLPCVTSNIIEIRVICCSLLDKNILKQKLLIFQRYTGTMLQAGRSWV